MKSNVLPLISVVVPTYNRSEMLRSAIDSLLRQGTDGIFSYEILIIDDASTDETRKVIGEMIKRSLGLVRYIKGEGKGYTRALNRGLSQAQGDWLAFFDDDELADPNWLKHLYTFAIKIDSQCVGGCRVLALPEEKLAQLGPICRGLLGEKLPRPDERKCSYKSHPAGGHMLIKRTVFRAVGVFDETLLTGGCDRDLVLRAMEAGFATGFTSRAVVRHMISPQRITPDHFKWYSLQFGSSFAYIDWKHLGRWKTVLSCLARIGQALVVNLPLLFLARLSGNQPEIMDRKALLWRAVGYSRRTLFLIAPRVFSQVRFFNRLEFRKEREILKNFKAAN